MGIYLLKVNNKSFNKKRHQSNLTDIGTLRVGVTRVSSLLTLKRFYNFSQHFTVEFRECCQLDLPTEIKVQTSEITKHARTGANHIASY